MAKSSFKSFIKLAKIERSIALAMDKDLADIALETEAEIKDRTPTDTGDLKNSMVARKNKFLDYEVATNLEYAPFIEYGTSRMSARAMMRRGAAAVTTKGVLLLRRSSKLF